jgi:hypothetical protein
MRWFTLFKKLGNQPLKITQNHNVYAVLENPKTGEWEEVPLYLKFDAHNRPYFIRDTKAPLTHRQNGKKG